MDVTISNASGKPIYEQIYTQIKNQILVGKLKAGEALPSMRFLAKELRISVITTKRAYEELEREGFIFSQTGKGSFVAETNPDFVREEQLKIIEEHFWKLTEKAKICGIELAQLEEMLRLIYEQDKGREK
ncbi:MAG: GntR family transcriptional regulator [Peptostreptococcaceae bacterium]|nr:GntR family transcriptional regulator [Peptostreptococcaceae bacterium]